MNREIARLFVVVAILFMVLVGFTSWRSVIDADDVRKMQVNDLPLLQEQQIPRGLIRAADGTLLAANETVGRGEQVNYVRRYPEGSLFSHALGYSFFERGRAGIEQFYNDDLTGREDEFTSLVEQLVGREREGEDLRSTLDPGAQRTAIQGLGGRRGSIVALEPDTGRVRVMVSIPDFDPNQVASEQRFREFNSDRGSPLLNRATQSTYPPGSTMKVVTAAAALDSGRFNPDSVVSGRSPKEISGVPLSNCCGEGTGNFGSLTLTQGLTNSVNTVWAEVGEKLGRETMVRYMQRFGFYSDPPLDYPGEQMAPSGVFNADGDLVEDGFDVGRVAIGQGGAEGQLRATPLQMAMVAAAVANDGRLMRPRLIDRIVRNDGRTRELEPEQESQVMSQETADQLTEMMTSVVTQGTARAAAIPGVSVAGKTGTAEVQGGDDNQAWFIAFAPTERPRIAIAVTIERAGPTGTGGEVAAPVAKNVLQALLGRTAGR